ncbi:MAG: hypothetical protein H6Q84_3707 [Deltaproteobacteria bacterium]|nr:hypothetical protein [Deltaproteobacteria bacterium]
MFSPLPFGGRRFRDTRYVVWSGRDEGDPVEYGICASGPGLRAAAACTGRVALRRPRRGDAPAVDTFRRRRPLFQGADDRSLRWGVRHQPVHPDPDGVRPDPGAHHRARGGIRGRGSPCLFPPEGTASDAGRSARGRRPDDRAQPLRGRRLRNGKRKPWSLRGPQRGLDGGPGPVPRRVGVRIPEPRVLRYGGSNLRHLPQGRNPGGSVHPGYRGADPRQRLLRGTAVRLRRLGYLLSRGGPSPASPTRTGRAGRRSAG